MHTTQVAILLMTVAVSMSNGHPPGVFVHGLHAPYSSDTKIVRDGLGNQATSYAYQDGHSSSVALSRTDVDSHLVPVPVAEPVVAYHHPPPAVAYTGHGGHGLYHHGAPAPAFYNGNGIGPVGHGIGPVGHGIGPVGHGIGPVGPAVYHQAPAGYHHGPGVFNNGYGGGFGPGAYNNYF